MSRDFKGEIESIERRLFLEKGMVWGTALTCGGGLLSLAKTAGARAFNAGQWTIDQQREQLLIILFWANRYGYIALDDKMLVVPNSGIKMQNAGTIMTQYKITPSEIIAVPEGIAMQNAGTIMTQYKKQNETLTAIPEGIKMQNAGTIMTQYKITPSEIIAVPEGIKAQNTGTIMTQYKMQNETLTAIQEGIKAQNAGTIMIQYPPVSA